MSWHQQDQSQTALVAAASMAEADQEVQIQNQNQASSGSPEFAAVLARAYLPKSRHSGTPRVVATPLGAADHTLVDIAPSLRHSHN